MQMNVTKSLYRRWHQAHIGCWKWSNTHYKLAKITCRECQCPWPLRMSSLSRIVCAKTRYLEIKDQEGPKGFSHLPDYSHPETADGMSGWSVLEAKHRANTRVWVNGTENRETTKEEDRCGWLSLGHLTQNHCDSNLILGPRTQEHILPVRAPAQGQRSMFLLSFCKSKASFWLSIF